MSRSLTLKVGAFCLIHEPTQIYGRIGIDEGTFILAVHNKHILVYADLMTVCFVNRLKLANK